ncbi:LLM class F420-dependent oxidoreductase [Streptomyces gamaensis]|uniref:LLM class F420-dependent oxidoreductase n=1 Tax=Streptomyces gamaensis TaxID=1763542 RepID=A0ABW0YTM0_9ACTN
MDKECRTPGPLPDVPVPPKTRPRTARIGVWFAPQHTTVRELRAAWREADSLGVDSLWLWDHFFPLTGDPDGTHFECWTLLAAMAAETTTARVGTLVSNYAYRNPDLLADMARTVDHIAGGRMVLGLGAGWFERDLKDYGYPVPGPGERVRGLIDTVARIDHRLGLLRPGPLGELPLLIGGDGRQRLLRLAAERAVMWNTMAWRFAEGNRVLDDWCARIGRDPAQIERSAFVTRDQSEDELRRLVDAGVQHLIFQVRHPFRLDGVRLALRVLRDRQDGRP